MPYTQELFEEVEILALYNLDTTQAGIKVHKTAGAHAVAAAERLHQKGLVTQVDGGLLTNLGLDAAEQAQALLRILESR